MDTARGIAYQQAQAVLHAIDMLDEPDAAFLRVEGTEDIIDLEVLASDRTQISGCQFKTRQEPYTWSKGDLLAVLKRWGGTQASEAARFSFVTDGRLGPSGEKVAAALAAAASGNLQAISALLGVEVDSPQAQRMARVSILTEPTPVWTLLRLAERLVVPLLPRAATGADVAAEAEAGVNRLFALLMMRASDQDPARRIVSRDEITGALGLEDGASAQNAWSTDTRDARVQLTLKAAVELPATVGVVELHEPGPTTDDAGLDNVEDSTLQLLAHSAVLLAGGTGTGKTTTLAALPGRSAASGHLVVVVHAEAYVPGRLAALMADGLSLAGDRPVSVVTGRAALADSMVTLAIDGVSEIPTQLREALAEELRVPLATQTGARVILAGRDLAILRSVVPTSIRPKAYTPEGLNRDNRRAITARFLGLSDVDDSEVGHLAAAAEKALQAGADNPYLFTMAISLINGGLTVGDRVSMYKTFIESMAARTGSTNIAVVSAALGIIFSNLLDEGRRYCDPLEWALQLPLAAKTLNDMGITIQADEIDKTARVSGLVVPIGYGQVLAPAHDSLADFLAAEAHVRVGMPLPQAMQPSDIGRLTFVAMMVGVDHFLATAMAQHLPFATVPIAQYDVRAVTEASLPEIRSFLARVMTHDPLGAMHAWSDDGGRTICTVLPANTDNPTEDRWVTPDEGRTLFFSRGGLVIVGGPLSIAVALWRASLQRFLDVNHGIGGPRPQTPEEMVAAVTSHAKAIQARMLDFVPQCSPPNHSHLLRDAVGPTGMSATIGSTQDGYMGEYTPLAYSHTDQEVRVEFVESMPTTKSGSHTSVEFFLADSPSRGASLWIKGAINGLTTPHWLD